MSSVQEEALVSWSAASNADFHGYLTLTNVQQQWDVHATVLTSGGAPHISVRAGSGTDSSSPEKHLDNDKLLQVPCSVDATGVVAIDVIGQRRPAERPGGRGSFGRHSRSRQARRIEVEAIHRRRGRVAD